MQATVADGLPDPTSASASASEDTPRPNILRQLWHQRTVFGLTFCAAFLLIMGLLLVLPVSYVATGAVIVTDLDPLVRNPSATSTQKIGDPADMESTILLIRSPRLLRLLLGEPGVPEAIESDCRAVSRQLLARLRPVDCSRLVGNAEAQFNWVDERFGISAVGRSRVLSVAYKSASPDAAPVLVNGLIRTFLSDELGKMLRSRDEAIDWVRQRLRSVGADMQRDEAAIETYRTRHGLVRGIAGPLSAERLTQAAQQLSDAKAAEAEATMRFQEASGGSSSRQALDSRSVSDLKQQLAQARAQAATLSQRLGSSNPGLVQARLTEANLTRQLGAETGRILDAARRNLDAAHARVAAAQQELDHRTEAASEAAGAETQIAAMVRELETKRGSFIDMSQRLNQLETERRILEPTTHLVNFADPPLRPAFPQRMPFLVGGLTLASVLATAVGLMTYRPAATGGQLALGRTYTRMPILAEIPELRLRRAGRTELLARKREFPLAAVLSLIDTHPPLLESLRILHARLALAGFGSRRRTLMITSEVSGEGKSFTTLALARLACASGRRVLVIETTLRQPFLEEALGGPPSPGFGGYLLGGPIDIVQLAALPGVDILLAGEPLSASTELLSGRRFAELLEWAKDYDLVLLDSAPVSDLMDSALLAPQVEGVLFCLRAGRPPARQALSSLTEIHRNNGNVVGLAITFVPDDRIVLPRLASHATMRMRVPATVGRT